MNNLFRNNIDTKLDEYYDRITGFDESFYKDLDIPFSNYIYLLVKEQKMIYDIIFEQYPSNECKEISRKERDRKRLRSAIYTYGEIDFISFGIIMQKVFLILNKVTI